jgi:pimeloyl-ACP methyl ester carboxylesterase
MPEVVTSDARLHVEVDGEGDPVTVLAHGLTNNCRELAMFTPFMAGTNVRFCFRGHGHSSTPESGFLFADFARDLDGVATEYRATRAVGTSLGAGAICTLIAAEPDRFERLIFLLPAGIDLELPADKKTRFLETADALESMSQEEFMERAMGSPDRLEQYVEVPWLADVAREMWADADRKALSRAIREIVEDHPVADREQLRAVEAPTMILCRENDDIHPVIVGEILADVMPNAELLVFKNDTEVIEAIPDLLKRAREFLE